MGDIIVISVLVLVAGLVIRSMVRDRKKGKCCGSCKGCSMAGSCHCNQE